MYAKKLLNTYIVGSCAGFSITFSINTIHNLIFNRHRKYIDPYVNNNQLNIYTNPGNFLIENIEKSSRYGLFWPVMPIMIYKDPRRFYNISGKYKYCICNRCH